MPAGKHRAYTYIPNNNFLCKALPSKKLPTAQELRAVDCMPQLPHMKQTHSKDIELVLHEGIGPRFEDLMVVCTGSARNLIQHQVIDPGRFVSLSASGICEDSLHLESIIVIVNPRFLEHPQKRGRRNQLIHRRLSKPNSIGNGSDSESDGYGVWN